MDAIGIRSSIDPSGKTYFLSLGQVKPILACSLDDRWKLNRMQDSSSGSTDHKFKLQLKAYAKVDAAKSMEMPWPIVGRCECIPVMVSITAPSGTTTEQRVPVDLAIILHVPQSRSWNRERDKLWTTLLTEALDVVVKKLKQEDRLAVIPPGSTLTTPKIGYPRHITSGIAQDAVINRGDISLVKALEAAESILQNRDYEAKKTRAAYMVIISNGNEDMGSLLPWGLRSVDAFGLRDARNAATMRTICSIRNCTYAVLDDEHGRITQAFSATIDRITSSAGALPMEVKLKCQQKVLLSKVDTPGTSYFISQDRQLGIIWPGTQPPGVTTNFIVYIAKPYHHDDLPKLLQVYVKHGNVSHKADVQMVTKGVDGSMEVAAEMVRAKAVKIVANIIFANNKDKPDLVDLHTAAYDLHNQWEAQERSNCGTEAGRLITGLSAQMHEMETRLYNNYYWMEYMLSWHSYQQWQKPLPPLFMDKQSPNDPLMQLRILAADHAILGPGTATEVEPHQQDQKGLPVLVCVMARKAGLDMVKRASIDLVIVIDAHYRGSRYDQANLLLGERPEEKRLFLLTEAMALVTDKLSPKDRLAIVPVQTSHPTLVEMSKHGGIQTSTEATIPAANGLLEMSKQGRRQTSTKVQSLVDVLIGKRSLDTRPATPLPTHNKRPIRFCKPKKALKLLRNCLPFDVNSSTTTLTSSYGSQGTATMALHSADAVRTTTMRKALMDAVKILDDRQGEEKDRLGFIVVISDRNDNIYLETLSLNYITHAFGFYNTHNLRAMYHIASSSNGIYDIFNDDLNQLSEAFVACINKITSIIAVDTKVEITCCHSSSVVLSTIESGQFRCFIDNDRKSSSILFGAMYAGTVRNFIIYVDKIQSFSKLMTVHVKWLHVSKRMENLEGEVVEISKEVAENIAHVELVKIINEITGPIYKNTAANLRKMCHKCSELAEAVGEDHLAREMKKMEDNIATEMKKIEDNLEMEIKDPSYRKNIVYKSKEVAENTAHVKLVKTFNEITGLINENKLMAADLQKMCHECSELAQAVGENHLAKEMKKIEDNLTREMKMEDNLEMELIDLGYNKYLVDISTKVASNTVSVQLVRTINKITGLVNNSKVMAADLQKMCHECSELAQAVGKNHLAMEMKKMEDNLAREMEDSLEMEIIDPDYNEISKEVAKYTAYVKLVKTINEINALINKNTAMTAYLRKMCPECSKLAQAIGDDHLSREMKKIEDNLRTVIKKMENNLKMEIEDPGYYKNLVDISKDVAENTAYVNLVKTINEITGLINKNTVIAVNLRKMCQECSERLQDVGEDHLAREMKNMQNNLSREMKKMVEDILDMEIKDPGHYKNLLPNMRYMLSWLSYRRSLEQVPSLPCVV